MALTQLLREFRDLINAPTIKTGSICSKCSLALSIKEAQRLNESSHAELPASHILRRFPCGHTYCKLCSKWIRPNPSKTYVEEMKCLVCWAVCSREDITTIQLTDEQRWDRLVKAARRVSVTDHANNSGEEEEQDENFIDDGPLDESRSALCSASIFNCLTSRTYSAAPSDHHLSETSSEPDVLVIPQTPSRLKKRRATSTPEVHTKQGTPSA